MNWLQKEFGTKWFPLANDVQKLGNGTEVTGLGVAILNHAPGDIEHAQGASYLGVVLDHLGVLKGCFCISPQKGIFQSRTMLLLVPHLISLMLRDKRGLLLNVSNDAFLT